MLIGLKEAVLEALSVGAGAFVCFLLPPLIVWVVRESIGLYKDLKEEKETKESKEKS